MTPTRMSVRYFVLLAAIVGAGRAAALDGIDFGERAYDPMKTAGVVQALGPDAFGEAIDTSTGALSFSHTDLSLPGTGPAVAVTRTLSIDGNKAPKHSADEHLWIGNTFGDWELELPWIGGTYAESVGWQVNTTTPNNRCGTPATPATDPLSDPLKFKPKGMTGTNGVYFSPESFWNGISLNLPGGGTTPVLVRTATSPPLSPSSGGPWTKLTTNDHWRFACVATITGASGQGFLALAPDGSTYRFDYMVSFAERPRTATETRIVMGNGLRVTGQLAIRQYRLMPTRVVDRFGNGVTYTWSGDRLLSIVADDGRTLTFTHETSNPTGKPRRVLSVSDGTRTVTYAYATPSQRLTTVTLPGHSAATPNQWTIDASAVEALVRYVPPGDAQPYDMPMSCQSMRRLSTSEAPLVITHPSGATASFQMGFRRYWRTNRHTSTGACQATMGFEGEGNPPPSSPYIDNKPWDNTRFDALSVLAKTVSGNLLTPAQWQFSRADAYCIPDQNPSCYADVDNNGVRDIGDFPAAGTRTVTETRPDGSQLVSVFGTAWNTNEGQLLSTRVLSAGPVVGELTRTDLTYVQTDDIGDPGYPFPSRVGDSLVYEFQPARAAFTRPLKVRKVTQQGVEFIWQSMAFDVMARATMENRRSQTVGASTPLHERTDSTTWYDDTAPWVLSQVAEIYNEDLDRTLEYRIYDPDKALPTQIFGEGVRTSSLGAGLKLFQQVTYDSAGRIATVRDGRLNTTTVGPWNRGIPLEITYADTSKRKASVNALGQVTQVTDQANFATGFNYDTRGMISGVTYPTEPGITWNGTTQGFVKSTVLQYGLPVGTWRQTVTTGAGVKTTWFDALWRPVLTEEVDTSNAAATRRLVAWRYDYAGRVTFTGYSLAGATTLADFKLGTSTSYDGLGRTVEVLQDSEYNTGAVPPFGNRLRTTVAYISGFQTQATDPRLNVTTTEFFNWDEPSTERPKSILMPLTVRTDITRDAVGRTTRVRRSGTWNSAPLGFDRDYRYNVHGELERRWSNDERMTYFDYDAAGNLTRSYQCDATTDVACGWTVGGGRPADVTVRTYDVLNRVTRVDFPAGTDDVLTTYTADGQVATVTTGSVVQTYAYNSRRMLASERLNGFDGIDWTTSYTYNPNGHLAALQYPDGLLVSFAPNALGQATQAGTFATGATYFPNGSLKGFTYGNQIVHTLTQNERGLPESSLDAYGGVAVLNDTYLYDKSGNIEAIDDALAGSLGDRAMTYDALNRLISVNAVAGQGGVGVFAYDPIDNIRQLDQGVRQSRMVMDAQNRLGSVTNPVGVTSFTLGYDERGNQNRRYYSTTEDQFLFDDANRLTSARIGVTTATGSGGTTTTYLYDGNGRRVRETRGDSTYSLYNKSGQLLVQDDRMPATDVRHNYIYLGGSLVAKRTTPASGTATTTWQHTDALGSPIATTDVNRVVTYERLTAYGEPADGTWNSGPGFTGHAMDAGAKLVYMQQRFYDPSIGRFLSSDPVPTDSNTGGMYNRYAYAANNPLRFVDPDGRAPCVAGHMKECMFSQFERSTRRDSGGESGGGGDSNGYLLPANPKIEQSEFKTAAEAVIWVADNLDKFKRYKDREMQFALTRIATDNWGVLTPGHGARNDPFPDPQPLIDAYKLAHLNPHVLAHSHYEGGKLGFSAQDFANSWNEKRAQYLINAAGGVRRLTYEYLYEQGFDPTDLTRLDLNALERKFPYGLPGETIREDIIR